LVLRVKGFSFPALPELAQMREMMQNELGEYNKDSALAWWRKHKDAEFPLARSKFHRIWESLWGMKVMQTLPDSKRKDAFWGYLHTVDLDVHAFEFLLDGEGGPQVLAHVRCSRDADADVNRTCEELGRQVLCDDRAMAEKFAASAANFCALLHARKFGQPSAKVDLIVKLLSAAEWWGPGTSGWQRWDLTWHCTDKVNVVGKVIKAQGRLMWHMEDNVLQVSPTSLEKADSLTKPTNHYTAPVFAAVCLTLLVVFAGAQFMPMIGELGA